MYRHLTQRWNVQFEEASGVIFTDTTRTTKGLAEKNGYMYVRLSIRGSALRIITTNGTHVWLSLCFCPSPRETER